MRERSLLSEQPSYLLLLLLVQLTMTYTGLSVMGYEVSPFGTIYQTTTCLFPNIIIFIVTTMTT